MGMVREQSRDLLHLLDADSISFADNSRISEIMASKPYSARPTCVVIDTIPAATDDVAADVVVVTVVVNIILPILPYRYHVIKVLRAISQS
ncbi:hypothetical protein Mpsy_0521 [Methanolobus psychrophilus R15]|nr:hypothetical protein Mpsy_0521 [Methanolobus psychrophilus R15]